MKNFDDSVKDWVKSVDLELRDYFKVSFRSLYKDSEPPSLILTKGPKFYKIVRDNSVWGFISRVDGTHKGNLLRKGDVLKPASFSSPAKHSRGNILDGSAQYTAYGVAYL